MEELQHELREEYRYYAFISYSHKDLVHAKWLQRKLQRYHLHPQLRKSHADLPRRIAPVFRDQTDLVGAVVMEALRKELECSQYLIVLCSPDSAASPYVDAEIRHFLSLGRMRRIIPFVVDGVPFSDDPATECFPPALREIKPELLGISVQELGRQEAFYRIVARLLRLPVEEVVMRERRRALQKKITAWGSGILAALTLAGVAYYNTEHQRCYNAYTYENEVPVGIYPLSAGERKGSSDCYRITKLRGKVIRLETVNSLGTPISPVLSSATTEYPIMVFEYDDDGSLIAVLQCDETGAEVSRKTLTHLPDGRIIVEFTSSATGEAVNLSADVSASLIGSSDESSKSQINRQDNTYDEAGRMISSKYYWHSAFRPVCDANGVYGKRYTYTPQGQIQSISNLSQEGEVMDGAYGWATIVMEYDEKGNLLSSCFYAADGSKAMCEEGYHGKTCCYDEYGNLEEMIFVDLAGNPCNCDDLYSRQSAQYDDKGFLTVFRVYNAQGAPVVNEHGVHRWDYAYDRNGRTSYAARTDVAGKPVADDLLGYAAVERLYDNNGLEYEQRLYGVNGEILCVLKMTYEDGREVFSGYEDGEGNPIVFMGYSGCRKDYDNYGNVCRYSYYDTDGALMLIDKGYAIQESEYDEYGNVVATRYYGTNGKLCRVSGGYAVIESSYEDGRLISNRYFDRNEDPVVASAGYHEVRVNYNDAGKVSGMEYLDTEGNLINDKEGYAVSRQVYDDYGNVIETAYFDAYQRPVHKNGEFHKVCYRSDSAGNMTHIWYYGVDGSLIMQPEGYAAVERDYDEFGDSIAIRYYGTENEPILYNGEYHEMRYCRDANRHYTHVWYYDINGGLVTCAEGYAALEADRDDAGNVISQRYYGERNEPILCGYCHEICWHYDTQGNMVYKCYRDVDGNLIPGEDGYAAVEYGYDDRGNRTSVAYFGTEEEPILLHDEYHSRQIRYDDRGNAVRAAYFGTDGQPCEYRGYYIIEWSFDENNNVISQRYYGRNNEPIMRDGAYHEVRWDYDADGNEIRYAEYDTEGNLIREMVSE